MHERMAPGSSPRDSGQFPMHHGQQVAHEWRGSVIEGHYKWKFK